MYVTLVQVHVKPEYVAEFIQVCAVNHLNSIKESGNLRFDVLQMEADSNRFILYEAYRSKQDAQAHKSTPHYLQWRDTVANWMAEPRQGVVYNGLFPT